LLAPVLSFSFLLMNLYLYLINKVMSTQIRLRNISWSMFDGIVFETLSLM
jgi:hypothetical protein